MTRFAAILSEARARGRAIGAFTCYNLETAEAVVRVAEARAAPAILLVSASSFVGAGTQRLLHALKAVARSAAVEVLVEIDHVADLGVARRAIDLGVDVIMADGSKLPFNDNVAYASAVQAMAEARGIGVEVELGRVEGHEDRSERASSGAMTEAGELQRFVQKSPVDCVAVAIGNVHGHYAGAPRLDWDRLRQLREATPVPLSLHGVSGLASADLATALELGICKLNVNTELRAVYLETIRDALPQATIGLDLQGLTARVVASVAIVVEKKFDAFGWAAAADGPNRANSPN